MPFAAALLLAAAAGLGCAHAPPASGEGRGFVNLSVKAAGAEDVLLILMRTGSREHAVTRLPVREQRDGTWSVSLDLIPGTYRYFFLVDGTVTVDGGKNRLERDDFGGQTGLLTVRRTPDGDLRVY